MIHHSTTQKLGIQVEIIFVIVQKSHNILKAKKIVPFITK